MDPMKWLSPTSSILSIVYYGLSIVGLLSGGGSDQQQLEQELSDIDDELSDIESDLDEMNQELEEIEQSIAQLATELNIDTQKLEAYIEQAGIENAIATIQNHFGDTPATGLEWFLTTEESNGLTVPVASAEQVEQFAANVLGAWDISSQVQLISDALLGHDVGTNAGLLEQWCALLITEMGTAGNSDVLYDTYQVFEGYYLQQLDNQVRGLELLLNAYGYDEQTEDVTEGESYYENVFAPMIEAQISLFIECVESMVVSQITLATDDGTVTFPSQALETLTRADLLAGMALANFSDDPQPGLVGRYLGPASAIAVGTSPVLQPSLAGLGAQTGKPAPPTVYLTPTWQENAAPYTTLESLTDSKIGLVRYGWVWPDPEPTVGQPISIGDGVTATPRYYDLATRQMVDQPGDDTVLFAEFLDTSGLVSVLVGEGGWTNAGTSGDIEFVNTQTSGPTAGSDGAVTASYKAAVSASGMGIGSGTYVFTIKRSLASLGSGAAKLNVGFDLTLSMEATVPYNSYGPQPVLFTPKLTITSDSDSSFTYDSSSAGVTLPTSAPTKETSVQSLNNSIRFEGAVQVNGSDSALAFHLQLHTGGGSFQSSDNSTTITLTVNSLSVWYDTPVLSPS